MPQLLSKVVHKDRFNDFAFVRLAKVFGNHSLVFGINIGLTNFNIFQCKNRIASDTSSDLLLENHNVDTGTFIKITNFFKIDIHFFIIQF